MELSQVVASLHDAPFRPAAEDIEALAQVTRLRRYGPDDVITWFDRPVVGLESPSASQRLADVLYLNAYTLGHPAPLAPEPTSSVPAMASRPFAADTRLVAITPGWSVRTQRDHLLTLTKAGEPTLVVPVDDVDGSPDTGLVSVRVSPYSEARLPGFASVLHGAPATSARLTRLYLNTTFDSIPEVTERLVVGLLDAGVQQFLLKWLLTIHHDARADSTVLYVDHAHALGVISATQELRLPLRPLTPMFTRRLADGMAIAADPGAAASFGQHACIAAARELIARLSKSRAGPRRRARRAAAARSERADGPGRSRLLRAMDQDRQLSARHLLEHARMLEQQAIWHRDRAGWLTCPPTSGHAHVVAAGADVYSGAPGPVLALAHATRELGSDEFRQLARAAANDIAQRSAELPAEGFHTGSAGTAAVLAEAAVVADDPELLRAAEQVCETARARWRPASTAWDIVGGQAGFALGLMLASTLMGRDCPPEARSALDRAVEIRGSRTSGWRSAVGTGRRALTGVAHGCFGAALALHEGGRHFDVEQWDHIVVSTVDFGRDNRDPITGRWLDRRIGGHAESASWCHGAAGIGLACTSLAASTPGARAAADDAGIQMAEWLLEDHGPSQGLCHGRLGVILSLSDLGRQLDRSDWVEQADAACRSTEQSPPRPTFAPDLSLMTGTSGIAIGWYLAAHGLEPPLALSLRARAKPKGRER